MIYIPVGLGLLAAALALNWYVRVLIQLPKYKHYWDKISAESTSSNAITIVALGDSLMQGMGADRPEEGLFGRIIDYVGHETNRPVAAHNLSRSGAKVADIVSEQLPTLLEADLYVITAGSNDSNRMSNLAAFEKSMDSLLQKLPADRTILADIGYVGRRAPYQAVVEKLRSKYGIHAATLEASKFTYTTWKEKWRFLARDFFHPSSYGYTFWFAAFRPAIDELIKKHELAK